MTARPSHRTKRREPSRRKFLRRTAALAGLALPQAQPAPTNQDLLQRRAYGRRSPYETSMRETLPKIRMPNRDGFVPARPDWDLYKREKAKGKREKER